MPSLANRAIDNWIISLNLGNRVTKIVYVNVHRARNVALCIFFSGSNVDEFASTA